MYQHPFLFYDREGVITIPKGERKVKVARGLLLCVLFGLLNPVVTQAAEKAAEQAQEQAIPEMVVESERLVEKQSKVTVKSEGLPSEVNIITKEDLKRTPITDYLDIFRKVPGVYVAKYTGGDYGDKIGMRGFNSGHGVQVAFFVDNMPMNMMTYYHGMSDIAWVAPEMIERIEIIKGPFSALYGDFALGGVINIITKKSDPSPSVGIYGGSYNAGRAVGVLSDADWKLGPMQATPFLVWEGYTKDGYRNNQEYRRGQFFNKLTIPLFGGELSGRVHYVARTWGDPGYVSIPRIKQGLLRRTSAVNDNDRGMSEMIDTVINYTPSGGDGQGFYGTFYHAYHQHDTGRTFPPSPQGRRDTYETLFGYKLMYNFQPVEQFSLIAGTDLRHDESSMKGWDTWNTYYNKRRRTRSYDFTYFSTGFYAQTQIKPVDFFKLVGGLRYDMYEILIKNHLFPLNSGYTRPNLWSPKIGFVITPYKDINIFANKGRGFRSPGVLELSPASATQRKNFDAGLSKLETWDVGFNALLFERFYLGFDYFDTRYARELYLNPATAVYENLGTSKRTGIEIEAKIFLTRELTIYGSWTDVRARLKNPTTPGQHYITGVPEDQATVGFEYQKPWDNGNQQFGLDFYYLRIGRQPVNNYATIIGSQFDRFMSKVSYRYKNWTGSIDAALTPRRYASDIYTTSAGEVCYTPWPKWEVIAGLRYDFR